MGFRVLIPARYASTRLPGKPLIDIAGKPMLQRVHEQAVASGAESVVIAADDARIEQAARAFGASVCMTSTQHSSGSERLAEAVQLLGYGDEEIVVNLQGDEPLVVFCHHGVRSYRIVDWLRKQGVENCTSMRGGIDRWSVEVDPTIRRY